MAFGTELRRVRTGQGLSGAKLARLTGVAPSTILRIERGGDAGQEVRVRILEALESDAATEALRAHLRDNLRWEEDPVAQYVTAAHPDGLSSDEIASVFGLSVDTVEADIASALRKLAANEGEEMREWADTVRELIAMRDRRLLLQSTQSLPGNSA